MFPPHSSRVATVAILVTLAGCAASPARYNPSLLESAPEEGSPFVPQDCGPEARLEGVVAGMAVVLRNHRPVRNDRNWVAAMRPFVGRTTFITRLAGQDPFGCPVVRVEVDDGVHVWRARDLTVIGRGLGPGGGDAVPQQCGQDDESADYGLVGPSARVILWRHRIVEGEANWIEEMMDHVGHEAEVTELGGVDDAGCPVFHIDVDRGEWAWRVRDVSLLRPALPQACPEKSPTKGQRALNVGATVKLGHHRPVRGERGWHTSMERYVGHYARVTALGPTDDQGCPVVRVDIDGGARPWRVRDLVLFERGRTSTSSQESDPIPQDCGQRAGLVNYGAIHQGVRVTLGRHRSVDGELNWSEGMEGHVGVVTTVTTLSGIDTEGCPGVRVEADDSEHFWRVRDLQISE